MEENFLIKSKRSAKFEKVLRVIVCESLIFAVAFFVAAIIGAGRYSGIFSYIRKNDEWPVLLFISVIAIIATLVILLKTRSHEVNRFKEGIILNKKWMIIFNAVSFLIIMLLRGEYDILLWIFFFVALAALLSCIVYLILKVLMKKSQIVITENGVQGRTLFGKQVNLPISQISVYSTRKLFEAVCIGTASGLISFPFIENYKEIGAVLRDLIQKRQDETKTAAVQGVATTVAEKGSPLQDLKTLKELLDCGALTQEEFDEQKKQILG